jgi:predicted RNase H-like nuclease
MRILGADLRELDVASGTGTIVILDTEGAVATVARVTDLPSFAREASTLTAGEPFLLAVDVPVAWGPTASKSRRVDGWVRRRLGVRLPTINPGGTPYICGSELIAALAMAGHPCLPYPDRDRRQSGLVEVHPELVAKALLWETGTAARTRDLPEREAVLRAIPIPAYRELRLGRTTWGERYASLDAALRALSAIDGFDFRPAQAELERARSDQAVAAAAALFDATLLAGAARRYLEEPERCAFVGLRESGYVVLPADAFLRRVALREPARVAAHASLFPRESLASRLAPHAALRPSALLDMPGQTQRIEAVFDTPPRYEFDNLDEMMWWKHCRHLAGPELPIDGLHELVVRLDAAGDDDAAMSLRLVRSRHKTLSFRFEPPAAWRPRVPPRDGKTYPFRVLRATFDAAPK